MPGTSKRLAEMCGIAGVIGRLSEDNRQALKRMSEAVKHRGPDDDNTFESAPDSDGRGVLLAHRRLSILDLSNAGSQPMTDAKSPGHTIVFNGEIYNYGSLRSRLQASGEKFAGSGDTEVMLRLLAKEGIGAVQELRGMFALALWDASTGCLSLARDPMGIKPLYVCRNPDPCRSRSWSFMFASEVRAILASKLLGKPRLDPVGVASVMWNGFVAGPHTIVNGVELMSAGQILTLDTLGQERVNRRFWHVGTTDLPETTSISDVRDALRESVKLHLASDVPLGVFLSGGVDSSVVANLAVQTSQSPIHTFTLAFDDPEYDESPYAREIAKALGTEHQETVLTERRFIDTLDQAIDSIDQPTFDALNSYYTSRAVREAGIKVALLGTGGDELFGGYRTFRVIPRFQSMMRWLKWIPQSSIVGLAKASAMIVDRQGGDRTYRRWAKLPEMMARSDDLLHLYQIAYALFVPELQREILLNVPNQLRIDAGLPAELQRDLRGEIEGRSVLAALGKLEQQLFLGQRLLRDTDVASMAVSLEARLPLVDCRVTDVISRLPDEDRFAPLGQKQLLRTAGLEGLDPELFDRAKRGFVMPFDRWIRNRLGSEMDDVMGDTQLCAAAGLKGETVGRLWRLFRDGRAGLYWSRIWSIYVLLRWCDRHKVTLH